METALVWRLAAALLIGLVVGIERGWETRQQAEGGRTAGVRTFTLAGLLGAVAALLAEELGSAAFAAALVGLVALAVAAYLVTARAFEDVGITTEVALVLTFGLGALAMRGLVAEAMAAAVVTAIVLGTKQELHHSLERLERSELAATLQLLAIAVVVVPLLPARGMGPWGALEPRTLGLLVLLIAGISYVGYFAIRLLGERAGVPLTAVLGGLTSSTAVAVSFARMAHQRAAQPALLGAGIGIAAAVMAPRLLVEVAVVERSLVGPLWIPLAVLAAVPLAAGAWVTWRSTRRQAPPAEISLRNPLQLRVALLYAAVLAALFVGVRAAQEAFGDPGVYALSALSGLADVDAIALSLASATGAERLAPAVAARGIVLAAVVNTGVKALLAAAFGGRAVARWCTSVLLAAALASGVAAWLALP